MARYLRKIKNVDIKALDDLKYELNRRIRAEKSIQNDDKNLDNLINIS